MVLGVVGPTGATAARTINHRIIKGANPQDASGRRGGAGRGGGYAGGDADGSGGGDGMRRTPKPPPLPPIGDHCPSANTTSRN